MSHRTDAYRKERAKAIAKLAKTGHTSKEIARIYSMDIKSIPAQRKLGETLLTLESDHG